MKISGKRENGMKGIRSKDDIYWGRQPPSRERQPQSRNPGRTLKASYAIIIAPIEVSDEVVVKSGSEFSNSVNSGGDKRISRSQLCQFVDVKSCATHTCSAHVHTQVAAELTSVAQSYFSRSMTPSFCRAIKKWIAYLSKQG